MQQNQILRGVGPVGDVRTAGRVSSKRVRGLGWALMCAVLLLGCQGRVSVEKPADYRTRVSELTVVYLDRKRMDVAYTGPYVIADWNSAKSWVEDRRFYEMPAFVGNAFSTAFGAAGVRAESVVVESLPEHLSVYSTQHVLIVDPYRIAPSTMEATITYALSLHERLDDKLVWQAESNVSLPLGAQWEEKHAGYLVKYAVDELGKAGLIADSK